MLMGRYEPFQPLSNVHILILTRDTLLLCLFEFCPSCKIHFCLLSRAFLYIISIYLGTCLNSMAKTYTLGTTLGNIMWLRS